MAEPGTDSTAARGTTPCPPASANPPASTTPSATAAPGVGVTSAADCTPGAAVGSDRGPVLHATRCPQCAGPLRADEGRRTLKCDRCGVRLLVPAQNGCARWFFPPRVERLQAVARGTDWLKEQPGILRAARQAHFVEATLLYAPIWEYRALVVGWEFGQKTRTVLVPVKEGDQDSLRLELQQEDVKEAQLHERRFYQAATDLEAMGATRPRISGRELALPLLPGEIGPDAFVLEAEGVPTEIGDTGRKVVLAPVSGAYSPDAHLFVLRECTTLLYYPLWSLHYRYRDRRYAVMVDGRNGTVHSGRAPATNVGRLAQLVGLLAALAVIVAVLAHATTASGRTPLPTVAAGVIVSAAALVSAWRFRLQGEVEYHEPLSS